MDENEIADRVAQEVAQEMQGKPLPPLSEEEIAARAAWREEIRERAQLERELEAWQAEADRQEQERLAAQAEARREKERLHTYQREAAERMARESRERDSLRAAERAAAEAAHTRARLQRLEAAEVQRQRNSAVAATVQRLGDALVPPRDLVAERLDEIEERLEPPYDPSRRFKFDWMD